MRVEVHQLRYNRDVSTTSLNRNTVLDTAELELVICSTTIAAKNMLRISLRRNAFARYFHASTLFLSLSSSEIDRVKANIAEVKSEIAAVEAEINELKDGRKLSALSKDDKDLLKLFYAEKNLLLARLPPINATTGTIYLLLKK